MLNVLGVSLHYIRDKLRPMVQFALHPQKPWGSLGWTAQDGHLDSYTAPELWNITITVLL